MSQKYAFRRPTSRKANSNLRLILVLFLLGVEIIGGVLIISYAYDQSTLAQLTLINVGCDQANAISNESSQVLSVNSLNPNTLSFPAHSKITVFATPPIEGKVVHIYGSGAGGDIIAVNNSITFILDREATIAMAC